MPGRKRRNRRQGAAQHEESTADLDLPLLLLGSAIVLLAILMASELKQREPHGAAPNIEIEILIPRKISWGSMDEYFFLPNITVEVAQIIIDVDRANVCDLDVSVSGLPPEGETRDCAALRRGRSVEAVWSRANWGEVFPVGDDHFLVHGAKIHIEIRNAEPRTRTASSNIRLLQVHPMILPRRFADEMLSERPTKFDVADRAEVLDAITVKVKTQSTKNASSAFAMWPLPGDLTQTETNYQSDGTPPSRGRRTFVKQDTRFLLRGFIGGSDLGKRDNVERLATIEEPLANCQLSVEWRFEILHSKTESKVVLLDSVDTFSCHD